MDQSSSDARPPTHSGGYFVCHGKNGCICPHTDRYIHRYCPPPFPVVTWAFRCIWPYGQIPPDSRSHDWRWRACVYNARAATHASASQLSAAPTSSLPFALDDPACHRQIAEGVDEASTAPSSGDRILAEAARWSRSAPRGRSRAARKLVGLHLRENDDDAG